MLCSLGIDIIEIDRFRQALERWPRLAARLFTVRERAYCDRHRDPAPHYAVRFAAKEATAKAVGRWLRWHDVEVENEDDGRPVLTLRGEAAALSWRQGGARALLSLSHSRDYAIACVLLVGPQETPNASPNLPSGCQSA